MPNFAVEREHSCSSIREVPEFEPRSMADAHSKTTQFIIQSIVFIEHKSTEQLKINR
jgi:hypothetical protein